MGTICILLGLILLIALTGGGFYLSNTIVANSTYMSLLGFANTSDYKLVYIIMVGLCFLIGLLICLNLVMHGLNSNKLSKLQAQVKRIRRGEH